MAEIPIELPQLCLCKKINPKKFGFKLRIFYLSLVTKHRSLILHVMNGYNVVYIYTRLLFGQCIKNKLCLTWNMFLGMGFILIVLSSGMNLNYLHTRSFIVMTAVICKTVLLMTCNLLSAVFIYFYTIKMKCVTYLKSGRCDHSRAQGKGVLKIILF